MPTQDYDVLIIGSGASGGMAAHTLTKKGVNCLMLDAGPLVDFNRVRQTKQSYELPYHGFGEPGPVTACLSGQRVQRQPVGGREGSALHARSRQAFQLGARADDRRQIALLGAHVVPPQRLRIQSQGSRRLRRKLAHRYTPNWRRSIRASSRSSAWPAAKKA